MGPSSDSQLNPARNITGTWVGTPVFTDRINTCVYEGTMELTLEQYESYVSGYVDFLVTTNDGAPSCVAAGSSFRYLVNGTISSSHIYLLVAETDALNGSFTTDLMTLRWELCGECGSGPAVKAIGMVSLTRKL